VEKTTNFFIGANVGMLIFALGIVLQLLTLNYKLNFELVQMGLVYLGQIISDLCIIFSFTFKSPDKKSTTTGSATKSVPQDEGNNEEESDKSDKSDDEDKKDIVLKEKTSEEESDDD